MRHGDSSKSLRVCLKIGACLQSGVDIMSLTSELLAPNPCP